MEQTKSKQELRKDWTAALRSGEYKQGKMKLSSNSGYCCLGVAGRLIGLSDDYMAGDSADTNNAYWDIQQAYGLSTSLGGNFVKQNLAMLNDSGEWTFKQIADFIDSNPDGLFID